MLKFEKLNCKGCGKQIGYFGSVLDDDYNRFCNEGCMKKFSNRKKPKETNLKNISKKEIKNTATLEQIKILEERKGELERDIRFWIIAIVVGIFFNLFVLRGIIISLFLFILVIISSICINSEKRELTQIKFQLAGLK